MADYFRALGYQQITSLSTAQALTVPKGTARALVQPESQSVRWRDDGTSPTATVGNILAAGDTLEYDAAALEVVKFIEVTASAKLNIHYYGA
jgi:hypothetical protein